MFDLNLAQLLDRIGFVLPTVILSAFFSGYSIFMGTNPELYLSLPFFHQVMYALIFGAGGMFGILAISLSLFKMTERYAGPIQSNHVGKLLSFYIASFTILFCFITLTGGGPEYNIIEDMPVQKINLTNF